MNEPLRTPHEPLGSSLLPLAGQAPPERADAARNRRRILDAARRIVDEQGAQALTMNGVAHASGIGVGTVYRRFGDVSALLLALLDEGEQRFQASFMSGPPPLGPGAPAGERLRAFLHAYAAYMLEAEELMLAAESASAAARYQSGPYRIVHTHVQLLIREARPELDAPVLAHLLLGAFQPSLLCLLRSELGVTVERLESSLDQLLGPLT
ncbi:TetR/AcrR family transcriptional regulator [Streptomyces indicus]|uniref:DNA-binding transcriptional regulator, AcrR family n=1 Tax=Streptomyces indicus TaxID=417292 RepID=A0A1G9JJE3_9ACTN|nr:TetR/AcrR family transcriptional regulator [Streptomyces indicus]SDL37203.1 DNA-binding transcriptional regulator, AcrR family [Streptomyces indicus]